ncbi:MAG: Elongation factor G [candidate division WS6 bacterium OLB20]|uniref:Elongation factor G n=1 Tax=candidate division WS6 bacterium OLB20 TaxID=1617426 RepID=A0A136LX15_9BACT|nr:MAG: Elongation factor G [candidate division WS6 bacterium OLB20]
MANKVDYNSVKDLQHYRNIGIIAHVDAGKTTTTERILYYTGKKHTIGEVHEGASEMDFMDQEKERGITIQSAATTCFWSLNDVLYRINIIDTPGHVDFTAEVERSLRVLDGACVIFDGKMGVEPQSSKVWGQADKYNVPRLCFINKLNLVGGDFEMSLKSIKDELSENAVAITYPLGIEHDLHGYVDLVTMQAYTYADDTKQDFKEIDIPAEVKDKVTKMHEELVEKIAEADDVLMEKYLNDGVLEVEEMYTALRILTLARKVFPVTGGDSRMADTKVLLNNIVRYLPSPYQKVYTYENTETETLEEYTGQIVGTDPNTNEKLIWDVSPDANFAGLVFKIAVDPHVGQIAFVRVYSGSLEAGSFIYNSSRGKRERVGRLLMMHANDREDISKVSAGDIVAMVGLKDSYTGNTVCSENNPILVESIDFPDPVVSLAIEPKTKSDQEKMGEALRKLMQEDPTFRAESDQDTGQTIVSGMGELHLDIKVDIMRRTYGIDVITGAPQVAYKETVEGEIEHHEVLKKQTGGSGQFADVTIVLSPQPQGEGYVFENEIKGGAIPMEFIPSVDKGIQESLKSGILGGYPVVDVKVRLTDGSYHEVDSNTDTFRIVGSKAFKEAMRRAKPILLEPIMKVVVSTPDEFAGDVTGALSSKRGVIKGMNPRGKMQEITAYVPLSNMFGWINDLRSMTKGKANSVMEFGHYAKVPENITNEVLGIKQ